MFKFLVLSFIFLHTVLAGFDVGLLKEIRDTCMGKTGVSLELIDAVNNKKEFADDEKLKCYMKCIMQEFGCMSDDGVIDIEAAIKATPAEMKEKVVPVIEECGTKVGANPCENAWLTHKCYQTNLPEIYFLP